MTRRNLDRPMRDANSQTFHVTPEQQNETLAANLRKWLPGKSWADVRALVKQRKVTINGNLCLDDARRLKEGEVVKVTQQAAAVLPTEEDIIIRYLDAHIVIVEKPSGMTSLRYSAEQDWSKKRKQIQPTLDELIPKVIARQDGKKKPLPKNHPHAGGKIHTPKVRPVHRLDRETSGLMVFARSVEANRHLGQQFRLHTISRRYFTIVPGRVEKQTIDTRLVRDRGDSRRGSTDLPNVGKRSITHVEPIEFLKGYTLLQCRLETGRTHQIRIHLAELGHPVCGEKVYNQPLFAKTIVDRSGAPRVALHAAELGLEHPITGAHLHFEMDLPADLQRFLDRLRRQTKQTSDDPPT